ncbi:hypothetical protein ACFPLB_02915 [Aquamicrobium segne]|uniref:C-type lysozyme inhibitor domain-containing protein n=1 Tax=Aquamicrobium segne TaxID=469547 RepID=A0ABW0GVJ5_9HYPH
MKLRRMTRLSIIFLPLIAAACVSSQGGKAPEDKLLTGPDGKQDAMAIIAEKEAAQPGLSTYNCADGSLMTIRNLGTSIRVMGPDEEEELPASPANQRSRYGLGVDAIVLDGREALVMKGRQSPLSCTR